MKEMRKHLLIGDTSPQFGQYLRTQLNRVSCQVTLVEGNPATLLTAILLLRPQAALLPYRTFCHKLPLEEFYVLPEDCPVFLYGAEEQPPKQSSSRVVILPASLPLEEICQQVLDAPVPLFPTFHVEEQAALLLLELGAPVAHSGYGMTKEALIHAFYDPEYLQGVTKALYPDIGKQFGTSAAIVERSIRLVIGQMWLHGDWSVLKEALGEQVLSTRPSNSAFFGLALEYLHLLERRMAKHPLPHGLIEG